MTPELLQAASTSQVRIVIAIVAGGLALHVVVALLVVRVMRRLARQWRPA